jgi:hypothetical protein
MSIVPPLHMVERGSGGEARGRVEGRRTSVTFVTIQASPKGQALRKCLLGVTLRSTRRIFRPLRVVAALFVLHMSSDRRGFDLPARTWSVTISEA